MFHLAGMAKNLIKLAIQDHLGGAAASELLTNAWVNVSRRIDPNNEVLPMMLAKSDFVDVANMITHNKVLLVNADSQSPTYGQPFPVKDDDWEAHRTWLLIGGDILGRGLTIPQLTSSYFLRSTKKPNFDTVSQQMRFCGYRESYAQSTVIRAHQSTIDLFRYMMKIEDTVWKYATKWDKNRTSISGKIPPIMYASPLSAGLEPTRKNVRDPNLRDFRKDANGEILYSGRAIFNPNHVYQNVRNLRTWFEETSPTASLETYNEWTVLSGYNEEALQTLISPFITAEDNKQEMRAIASLFDEEMEELGLADRPSAVYVRTALLASEDIYEKPLSFWQENGIQRAMHLHTHQPKLSEWEDNFKPAGNPMMWGSLKTPHVGDSQRALVTRLPWKGTVLVLEPILGKTAARGGSESACGLGFTIFKPDNYEIRMIGHA